MAVRLTTLFHSTQLLEVSLEEDLLFLSKAQCRERRLLQKRLQLGHGPFCSARVITGNHYWKPGALYHWGLVEPIPKPFRLPYPTNPGFPTGACPRIKCGAGSVPRYGVGNDGDVSRTRSYGSTPSMTGCRGASRSAPTETPLNCHLCRLRFRVFSTHVGYANVGWNTTPIPLIARARSPIGVGDKT